MGSMARRAGRVALAATAASAIAVVLAAAAPARDDRSAAGTLTVAVTADGYFATPKWPTVGRYPTNANVAETLVRMTQNYRVVPDLAVRWKYVGNNTFRFFLRHGVKFQKGQPFNANAVKYTMDLYAASGAGRSAGIDSNAV